MMSFARLIEDSPVEDFSDSHLVESAIELGRFRERWGGAAEQVAVTALQRGARSLGFIGVDPHVGVRTFSRLLADTTARIGYPSLLVDLSDRGRTFPEGRAWTSPHADPKPFIVKEDENKFRLSASPTRASRDHFNDAPRLRQLLGGEAFEHRILVLSLPPLVGRDPSAINPVAAAAACDAVVLLCDLGRTERKHLKEAIETCRANEIKLGGLILNELSYRSPAAQIGRMGRRLFAVVPPLARWVESGALRAEVLR